jgi:hypothetical protein
MFDFLRPRRWGYLYATVGFVKKQNEWCALYMDWNLDRNRKLEKRPELWVTGKEDMR